MADCRHERLGAGGYIDEPFGDHCAPFCRDCGKILPTYRELRDAARELLAALPKCDAVCEWMGTTATCRNPATRAFRRGEGRWCWDHAPPGCPAYPREPAVRDLWSLLREGHDVP